MVTPRARSHTCRAAAAMRTRQKTSTSGGISATAMRAKKNEPPHRRPSSRSWPQTARDMGCAAARGAVLAFMRVPFLSAGLVKGMRRCAPPEDRLHFDARTFFRVPGLLEQSSSRSGAGKIMQRFDNAKDVALTLRPDVPVYCFRPEVLKADALRFMSLFPGKTAYAVKTNGEDLVLRTLAEAGYRSSTWPRRRRSRRCAQSRRTPRCSTCIRSRRSPTSASRSRTTGSASSRSTMRTRSPS